MYLSYILKRKDLFFDLSIPCISRWMPFFRSSLHHFFFTHATLYILHKNLLTISRWQEPSCLYVSSDHALTTQTVNKRNWLKYLKTKLVSFHHHRSDDEQYPVTDEWLRAQWSSKCKKNAWLWYYPRTATLGKRIQRVCFPSILKYSSKASIIIYPPYHRNLHFQPPTLIWYEFKHPIYHSHFNCNPIPCVIFKPYIWWYLV